MGGGGGVSHPSQLTIGLVIKSVTTSPTLAGERMLFILQVSILSEQTFFIRKFVTYKQLCLEGTVLLRRPACHIDTTFPFILLSFSFLLG